MRNILNANEAISVPANLKDILDKQIINLREKSEIVKTVKLSSFIHDMFFLYDLGNIITKTYINELERSILIYVSITYLGEINSTNEVDLITPQKKISFKFPKNVYKSQIDLELAKVKDEEKINMTNNKIQNFGIL